MRELRGITMPDQARTLVESVYEGNIEAPPALLDVEDKVLGAKYGERMAAGQNVLSRDQGYDRRASSTLWSPAAELTTRLGDETLDIYLAYRTLKASSLMPMWMISVGAKPGAGTRKWWRKHCARLPQLTETELEVFRKQQHRPQGIVLLLETDCNYYHQSLGLLGEVN